MLPPAILMPTRARQFDLIAFDWDGTLFDSTGSITRCIQLAVRDVGGRVPSDQDAAFVIGLGLAEALARAAPDVPEQKYPELLARYRHHYAVHQNSICLFEGVVPMLKELAAGQHFLAVATGKSRVGLNQALRSVELQGLFHASCTADETAGKPHPLMLQELMAELGVQVHRVLMVGDTTHDLQMAANAGCPSIGVSYGAHEPAYFEVFSPVYVAHSVQQLHAWLLANA